MVGQQRKLILNALVTQIKTEVTTFALVTDETLASAQLTTDQYPACIIYEGGDRKLNNITSSQDYILDVAIRILTKGDAEDDTSRDLLEEVVDAVNTDLTLDATCIFANVMGSDPPIQWPNKGAVHFRDMLIQIYYRRDF